MRRSILFVSLFALLLTAGISFGVATNKAMMKAIVVHEYGGPEVLKYEDVPQPEPKEDQVLVRVIAAGVNPVDALIRSGKYAKFFETNLPLIPGGDIAGMVAKTGTHANKFKVGDPVYAYVSLKN